MHETIGDVKYLKSPKNEEQALDRMRRIREKSDKYQAICEVMAGNFDADEHLLKRLACAVGCSQFDVETVVARAGQLAAVNATNAGLQRELAGERQKVEWLEEERDDDRMKTERDALARKVVEVEKARDEARRLLNNASALTVKQAKQIDNLEGRTPEEYYDDDHDEYDDKS